MPLSPRALSLVMHLHAPCPHQLNRWPVALSFWMPVQDCVGFHGVPYVARRIPLQSRASFALCLSCRPAPVVACTMFVCFLRAQHCKEGDLTRSLSPTSLCSYMFVCSFTSCLSGCSILGYSAGLSGVWMQHVVLWTVCGVGGLWRWQQG